MSKIIFIGDSITEGFKIEKYFPNKEILNKGIYGDNTSGVFARIEKDVIKEIPNKVFILIGTNDFALNKTNSEIYSNFIHIIKKLQDNSTARIYIMSILPVRNLENRNNERIKEVNERLKYICDEASIIFLDLFNGFLDMNHEMSPKFSEDGLHLTENGYSRLAELLSPYL